MDPTAKDLLEAALRLPPKDRAQLVGDLLESLDEDSDQEPAEVEAAWDTEIKRRVQDLEAGRLDTMPWPDVRAGLDAIAKKPSGS